MIGTKPRAAYRALLLGAGCVLFAYLLLRLEPGRIFLLILGIGWGFVGIVAAYAGHQLMRTIALSKCITANDCSSYWDLLRIRLYGEAVQFFTFTGPFLAEPTKALLLRTRGLTLKHALSATILEYLVYTFTSAAMAVAGLTYLLHNFELSRSVSAAAQIVAYTGGAFLVAAAYAIIRRIYLIGAVVRGAGRLPLVGKYLQVDDKALHDMEDLLFIVLRAHPRRFLSILVVEFIAQILLVLEIALFLRTTGQHFSAVDPFLIESATKFIGLGFFFIPGQVGAAEGAYAVIFQAVGLSASAGFSLALARRLRSLVVAGTGLVLLPR